jgi:hypothetical protein
LRIVAELNGHSEGATWRHPRQLFGSVSESGEGTAQCLVDVCPVDILFGGRLSSTLVIILVLIHNDLLALLVSLSFFTGMRRNLSTCFTSVAPGGEPVEVKDPSLEDLEDLLLLLLLLLLLRGRVNDEGDAANGSAAQLGVDGGNSVGNPGTNTRMARLVDW